MKKERKEERERIALAYKYGMEEKKALYHFQSQLGEISFSLSIFFLVCGMCVCAYSISSKPNSNGVFFKRFSIHQLSFFLLYWLAIFQLSLLY